ncbi:MAG: DNA-protecting protein DprA [Tissierellia bacterium]|nr:DNA-protecting protein DprA [Tissierellia bacterium]
MLYWIWLSQIKGVGPKRQRLLLEKFNTPDKIYNASLEDLMECPSIGRAIAKNIVAERSLERAKTILDNANSSNIKILTLDNPLYPQKSKDIEEMPILLYYKGKLVENSMGVAIVGSRRCSGYGKIVVHEAATYLAEENITVVSGMAKGIDGYAHTSCIKAEGYTIAVLGNGLDICYPPEHIELMEKIIENGAIISEYPPGTRPNPKYFPRRNLIISAWAYKILVIEAGAKSGSLITANFGRDHGREILAVPDNIYSTESKGSNDLIHNGAEIYLHKEQLLIENRYKVAENRHFDKSPTHSNNLDELEKAIMKILTKGPSTLEEISVLVDMDTMNLLGKLSIMELEGKVVVQGSRVKLN